MNFVASLFFGCEGSYDILGTRVTFQADPEDVSSHNQNCISRFFCNRAVYCLMGSYAHTFFHEMGHVIAARILSGVQSTVSISTNRSSLTTGRTVFHGRGVRMGDWRATLVFLAGPMTGVAFEIAKLALGFFVLPVFWPVGSILIVGSIKEIFTEYVYAIRSGCGNSENGDFGIIARSQGCVHAVFAGIALITEIVIGIFVVLVAAIVLL